MEEAILKVFFWGVGLGENPSETISIFNTVLKTLTVLCNVVFQRLLLWRFYSDEVEAVYQSMMML